MRVDRTPCQTFLGLTLFLAAAACGEVGPGETPVAPIIVPPLHRLVTSDVVASIDENNHFILSPPVARDDVSATAARHLASAWLRDYAEFNRTLFESDHGGPIDFDGLKPCRTVYAATPFELIERDAPQFLINGLASYWLVGLCDSRNAEVLNIGVSVRTRATVVDGHVVYNGMYGNDFKVAAIPPGIGFPITAEEAVAVAVAATGIKVAEVPQLVRPGHRIYPQAARWKVRLERPAVVRGMNSGVNVQVTELFVGIVSRANPAALMIAKPSDVTRLETFPVRQGNTTTEYHARLIADRPWDLERVMLTTVPR